MRQSSTRVAPGSRRDAPTTRAPSADPLHFAIAQNAAMDPTHPALAPPLAAPLRRLTGTAGPVAFYGRTPPDAVDGTPLLLIHSVNAAASAYEVRPLFEHYAKRRPVYAIDLPGYGLSDRSDRLYSIRLMTDAVLDAVDAIAALHGPGVIDGLAVSLSSEYLARAAVERPGAFRSVALVSATGLDRGAPFDGPPGSSRGKAWLLSWLGEARWSEALRLPLSFLLGAAGAEDAWQVEAWPHCAAHFEPLPAAAVDTRRALVALPPLIKAYLRTGARFGRSAVIDHQFGTTDVFTVMPMVDIEERYLAHYGAPSCVSGAPVA